MQEARENIRKFCVYRERSQFEVRQRLYEYGVSTAQLNNIIAELIQENFLNEERFVRAFVRGKFGQKQWGRLKIRNALFPHQLSEYLLKKAFEEIDEVEYDQLLQQLLEKRFGQCREKDEWKRNGSVARWLINRGFEADMVWDKIRERK